MREQSERNVIKATLEDKLNFDSETVLMMPFASTSERMSENSARGEEVQDLNQYPLIYTEDHIDGTFWQNETYSQRTEFNGKINANSKNMTQYVKNKTHLSGIEEKDFINIKRSGMNSMKLSRSINIIDSDYKKETRNSLISLAKQRVGNSPYISLEMFAHVR